MKPSPKNDFDFRMFMALNPLFNNIYLGEVLIPAVEREQDVFDSIIKKLKKYHPRTDDNISDKDKTLTSAQNVYNGREMIINGFKNKLFPFYSGNYYEELEEESSESRELSEIEGENEEPKDKMPDNTIKQITELDKFYGPDLISKYFNEKSLIEILNQLKNYKKKTWNTSRQ